LNCVSLPITAPLTNPQIKNRYPLPRIEDFLDHLQGASFFTKMDLTSSYHQVHMKTTNIWKTTFKTNFGIYEWLVMPFSLTNAPKTFMHLINGIFQPHLSKFAFIYIDNILFLNRSWDAHLQHVCIVLELLRQHHIQVKENKSYFVQTSVQYLGFIVD